MSLANASECCEQWIVQAQMQLTCWKSESKCKRVVSQCKETTSTPNYALSTCNNNNKCNIRLSVKVLKMWLVPKCKCKPCNTSAQPSKCTSSQCKSSQCKSSQCTSTQCKSLQCSTTTPRRAALGIISTCNSGISATDSCHQWLMDGWFLLETLEEILFVQCSTQTESLCW